MGYINICMLFSNNLLVMLTVCDGVCVCRVRRSFRCLSFKLLCCWCLMRQMNLRWRRFAQPRASVHTHTHTHNLMCSVPTFWSHVIGFCDLSFFGKTVMWVQTWWQCACVMIWGRVSCVSQRTLNSSAHFSLWPAGKLASSIKLLEGKRWRTAIASTSTATSDTNSSASKSTRFRWKRRWVLLTSRGETRSNTTATHWHYLKLIRTLRCFVFCMNSRWWWNVRLLWFYVGIITTCEIWWWCCVLSGGGAGEHHRASVSGPSVSDRRCRGSDHEDEKDFESQSAGVRTL